MCEKIATFVLYNQKNVIMKRMIFVLALAFAAVSLQAQLLWKVSGNNLKKDSYILGTVHVVPAYMMDAIPGMDVALNNCDIVVGEIDIKDNSTGDSKWYEAPSDSTLDKLYSPQEYSFIKETLNNLAGHELDFSTLNGYTPYKIITEIIIKIIASNDYPDLESTDLIDFGIQKRATEMGRQTMGLETQKFQDDLLSRTLPLAIQAEELLTMCKSMELEKLRNRAFQEIGAYALQKFDYFESKAADDDEELGNKRNRDWIPKIESILPEKSCLVVVGILHLVGEQGVLQMLRERGYTIEPMK